MSALTRIINIATCNGQELDEVTKSIFSKMIRCFTSEGWTEDEIVSYLQNMEEVNPSIPEETALSRMSAINDKVYTRLYNYK